MRPGAGWLGLGIAIGLVATPGSAGAQLRVGQGVSIEVRTAAAGPIVAYEVELLSEPRTLALRGPIEDVDLQAGRLTLFGIPFEIDPEATRIDEALPGVGLDTLRPGLRVEAKVRVRDGRRVVREVNTRDVKRSLKIKGTVSQVEAGASGSYLVHLDQVPIRITRSTDYAHGEWDVIREDLFGEQKADELLGEDSGYRIRLGNQLFVSGSVRTSARLEDSFSLQESADDRLGVGEPSARLETLWIVRPTVRVFTQTASRGTYEIFRSSQSERAVANERPRIQIRQLYLTWEDIGSAPVGLVIGKQRFRDPREFLFDEYLDGIRLYAYPFRPLVLEASALLPVAPLRSRYRTWRDALLQARLYLGDAVQARAYLLQRFDSDVFRARNVRYVGLAVDGDRGPAKAWAEGTLLRGEDKGKRQDAFAWDVGLSLRAGQAPLRPSITVGAARGSGPADGANGVSTEFRQTGYQDNSTRLWGIASFHRFGEALDPELTNLRVWTVGAGVRPSERLSVDLVAHWYRQDRASEQLDHVDLETPEEVLTGDDVHLGYGADLVLGVGDVLGGLDLSYRAGTFLPGPAFDLDARPAVVHRLEFRFDS